MIYLKRFNESVNTLTELETEIKELFHSNMPWKLKEVHMWSLAEDIRKVDEDKGNFWLGVIWFKDYLQDVEMAIDNESNKIFKKSDKVVMDQDSKNKYLYYNYYKIYLFLKSEYRLNLQSINSIVGMVVAEHYKIDVGRPTT